MNQNSKQQKVYVPLKKDTKEIKIKNEVIVEKKKKKKRQKVKPTTKATGFGASILGDRALNVSTDALIAATLKPEEYQSRGLSNWGGMKTALVSFTTKFVFNAFNSTSQSDLWLYILPSCFTGSWCNFVYSSSSDVAPATGWSVLPGVMSTAVITAQAMRSRFISFQIKLVPTGALTARSGTVAAGVYQVASTGPQAAGAGVKDTVITAADFKLQTDGNTPIVFTNVPSIVTGFNVDGFAGADMNQPNFIAHIAGTSGVQYAMFVTVRFEFVPLIANRPFFEVANPQARADTYDYLGYLINRLPALVLGSQADYEAMVATALLGRSISKSAVNWATSGGIGGGGPGASFADVFPPEQDIDGDADGNTINKVAKRVKQVACKLDSTGLAQQMGFCDESPMLRRPTIKAPSKGLDQISY